MSISRTWKRVAAAVCAGVMAASLAACGGEDAALKKDESIVNVATISTSQLTENWNPLSPTASQGTVGGLYEALFFVNAAGGDDTMQPMLGETYEFSDDYKELTIKLKDGLKWSDGKPITADDAVYTFNLINDNSSLNGSGFHGKAEKIDDTTFKLTYDQVATMTARSNLTGVPLVPKHVFEKMSDVTTDVNKDPVTSGPFTFKEEDFTPQSYVFRKNPNYHEKGQPYIDGVRYTSYAGGQATQDAIVAGDIDWASNVFQNPEKQLAGAPVDYITMPSSAQVLVTCSSAEMGCTGPQTDVAVRKAIYYGMDRAQMNNLAFYGIFYDSSSSLTPVPENEKWLSKDVPESTVPEEANVEKAKQLLEDAGYTLGSDGIYQKDGVRLSFEVPAISGWTESINGVDVAGQQLKEVGIEMKAKQVSANEMTELYSKGDYQIITQNMWYSGSEPYDFYNTFYASSATAKVGEKCINGWARYSNPAVDSALEAINSTNDDNEKMKQYGIIQQQVYEDMPYIPMMRTATMVETSKDFTGWVTEDNVYAAPASWGTWDTGIILRTIKPAADK